MKNIQKLKMINRANNIFRVQLINFNFVSMRSKPTWNFFSVQLKYHVPTRKSADSKNYIIVTVSTVAGL